jgi:hypothetical protein
LNEDPKFLNESENKFNIDETSLKEGSDYLIPLYYRQYKNFYPLI